MAPSPSRSETLFPCLTIFVWRWLYLISDPDGVCVGLVAVDEIMRHTLTGKPVTSTLKHTLGAATLSRARNKNLHGVEVLHERENMSLYFGALFVLC